MGCGMSAEKILEAVTVCAELTGTELSEMAKAAMVRDLSGYPVNQALAALERCRRELTGRLTLAAVLSRLEDGYPSADEAFGLLVEGWRNEDMTVIVPRIAQDVSGAARALFIAGDKTGARMAFRDAYEAATAKARMQCKTCEWAISAGTDKQHLASALKSAVRDGRIKQQVALAYLPCEATEERHLMLTGTDMSEAERLHAQHAAAQLVAKVAMKRITADV